MIVDIIASPDYRFLEDAYYATGGFKHGDYIVKRPRETLENYEVRKQLSYYLNYVKPVVDSHVNPIFRTEAARDWGGRRDTNSSNLFSLFYDNVDTVKTKLPKFMKRAARIAKLHGAAFIVVDNIKDQPGTMAEVLKQRAFPYAYVVKPHQVTDYTVNKAGALTSITYTIQADGSGSAGKLKEIWTWTETEWKCSGQDTTEKTGPNLLGKVPVVVLMGADVDPGELKPQSEFYSIAKANKRIYNLCSEIDEIITKQAFSIFTYPIGANTDQQDVKEMLTGTENAVCYDGTLSNAPDYVSPDSAQLEQLRAERTELIQEIYRMAQQSHVTGVETKTSGVAKSWDFEQTNQTLADFANNCEAAEYNIAELFELWTGATINYECQYSDDFGIVDVAGALDEVSKALDLNIGGKFNAEVKKKAVDVYLNDLPEDDFDAINADIDAMAQDEAYKFDGDPVASAIDILTGVASKTIAPEAAIIMMQSFFGMSEETAKSLLAAQETVIGLGVDTSANQNNITNTKLPEQ